MLFVLMMVNVMASVLDCFHELVATKGMDEINKMIYDLLLNNLLFP